MKLGEVRSQAVAGRTQSRVFCVVGVTAAGGSLVPFWLGDAAKVHKDTM